MLGITKTTSNTIKRLNHIITSNKRYYTSDQDENKKTYIRIGNLVKELKPVKSPEKIPKGYLNLYNNVLNQSQTHLKNLHWLMQKDELKQDSFLIGSPPGSFRRNLALSYAEMAQREVEYLCLTRDTTESDIKQRREVVQSSVIYVNQCAVNAALNGRILIIEGIEKAERNLLPILNNLLENREINLDDGHFLVSPERYDKLVSIADKNNSNLSDLNLLRVHEDFRVIAIGLPVPKYKGNLLDPPLRSRFQAHLVSFPVYDDFNNYLINAFERVNKDLIKNICDFGYSFYASEMSNLNLIDFPLENMDKIVRIMNNVYLNQTKLNKYEEDYLNTSKLINKIYPHKLILKNDDTNKKFYFDLMSKFNLPKSDDRNLLNEIDYKFESIEQIDTNKKRLNFISKNYSSTNKQLSIDLLSGNCVSNLSNSLNDNEFIMNDYHSSQLVDMFLNHSSGHDFVLVGPSGCGKTELIKKFSQLLNYSMQTLYLFKDMSSRDLLQQRVTLMNGDTKWLNSPLIQAAINGDLVVLGK